MSYFKSKIHGTGIYLPKKILKNTDLEKMVETNDQWIYERTGIRERRICSTDGGEFPTDMAVQASQQALLNANMEPNDIEMILFASVTPDVPLPNSASILQTKLGITNNCPCLDIAAACSGFVYGINMAQSFVATGMVKNVLVVGSEMLSRQIDWTDRSICILFGDGCGTAIIGRTPEGETSEVLSTTLGADGTGRDFFDQPIGGAVQPIAHENIEKGDHFMRMQGGSMFKVATRTLCENANKVIKMANMSLSDVDWLVPHQANQRIIETTGKLLRIDPEKVIINIEKYGNTSAATVPIALHEAITDGRIKRGDIVLLDAFGSGLTTGATLLRF